MKGSMKKASAVVVCLAIAGALQGCGGDAREDTAAHGATGREPAGHLTADTDSAAVKEHARTFQGLTLAIAVLQPTAGHAVQGTVEFAEQGDSVRVTTDITGLPANGEFGFHIHQWGDASSPDGSSAGDHYNPDGYPHALPPTTPRHAGDLGNLRSDATGAAKTTITVGNLSVAGLTNPILGRAILVHAHADDGSQPSGGAGDRLAVGVIGVAQAAGAAASPDTARAMGRAAGS